MGMNTSEATQTGCSSPGTTQLGDFDSAGVANDDMTDNPLSINEEPDLPGNFVRNSHNLSPEIQMDQMAWRNLAAIEAFEGTNFLGLETRQTPEKFSDGAIPLFSCAPGPLTRYMK